MRRSGILMHISSLPSRYGIGKLGASAYQFADFLKKSGVSVWQILPLSPTSYGDSPYQSFSAYAGNPYFIDFEQLEEQGLLEHTDYADANWGSPNKVDYERLYQMCFPILKKAFQAFDRTNPDYVAFCEKHRAWLPDYALFMALKFAHNGKAWTEWEPELAMRNAESLQKARSKYVEDVQFFQVIQYWFYSQWDKLKTYCNNNGISLIGDMPIYVSYDSVEVWAQPELFELDRQHRPIAVAGCPPDVFSPTGQLWGNPLYDWDYHKKTGYAWWIQRLAFATSIYDTVRIDHFRGFESYYSIPYGNPTAEIGEWRKGPNAASRFSRFTPTPSDEAADKHKSVLEHLKKLDGAEDFLDILRQMKEAVSQLPENPEALADTPVQEQAPASEAKEAAPAEPSVPPVRLFSFSRLDSVIHASHFLAEMYDGPNTLYKDEAENMYILTLAQGEHPSSDFNRICNMLSEYGSPEQGGGISLAFLEEHCDMILAKNAIQTLTSFK